MKPETAFQRRIDGIKTRCFELGLDLHDLEEMAGFKRGLIRQWVYRLKNNQGPNKAHVTRVRESTWAALNKTLDDLTVKKDNEALAGQREKRIDAKLAKKPGPVTVVKPEPVMQLIYETDKPAEPAEQDVPKSARETIYGLIEAKLKAMTFLELINVLVQLEGK